MIGGVSPVMVLVPKEAAQAPSPTLQSLGVLMDVGVWVYGDFPGRRMSWGRIPEVELREAQHRLLVHAWTNDINGCWLMDHNVQFMERDRADPNHWHGLRGTDMAKVLSRVESEVDAAGELGAVIRNPEGKADKTAWFVRLDRFAETELLITDMGDVVNELGPNAYNGRVRLPFHYAVKPLEALHG